MAIDSDSQNPTPVRGNLQERLLANIRVSWKLNLMILTTALGVTWIFFVAMQSIAIFQGQQQTSFERISVPATALNDAYASLIELRSELILLENPALPSEDKLAILEKSASSENIIAATLQRYEAEWLTPVDLTSKADVTRARREEIQQTLNALLRNEAGFLVQLKSFYVVYDAESSAFYQNIRNGEYDAAAYKRMDDSLVSMQAVVRQLISIQNERLLLANEIFASNYQSATGQMIFTLILAILFGWLISSSIARSIISRLNLLGNNALALQYDLLDRRATISISGQDEIAQVSRSFDTMSHRLREMFSDLEVKVEERTSSLKAATAESNKRAQQFQAVTQIAQRITSERDIDMLLSIITEVISAQFNYHHVAIYLNDDMQEFTTLSAASSEDGKAMMERGYRLPVKLTSLVGYVAKTGNTRTTADAPEESYTAGDRLPATRSELALPLKARDQIIGVLDVHSDRENAFDQTDVESLTALANQITIAIQNTRLFTETQIALAESQLLYGTIIKQTWKSAMQTSSQIGYRYTGTKPVPLQKEISTIEIREALDNDNITVTHPSRRKNENALAIPLKLRESTIGVINVNFPTDTEVGEDEIDLIVAASQRIALALENASLLEESQRRAKREQTISEMSAKIGAGTEVEAILKTAIQELSSHISSSQIMIELESEEEKE